MKFNFETVAVKIDGKKTILARLELKKSGAVTPSKPKPQ